MLSDEGDGSGGQPGGQPGGAVWEGRERFMQDNTLNSPYVTDCTFLEENQLATSA